MKNAKHKSAALLSCAAALMLTACASTPTPSFDTARPWHDTGDSYEKLVYELSIYNTLGGVGENERITIANGEVMFTLTENASRHTVLTMSYTVTYNENADEVDRGCTDTIQSRVEWQTDSLVTSTVTKTVTLAPREGETKNLSYEISADYFGKTAARKMYGETATMDIPSGQYYDNEMMFYLARTTSISENTSYPFYMTNLFDCFETGKIAPYTMYVSVESDRTVEHIGSWVENFGIEKITSEETGKEYFPISCYDASISISSSQQGPPYKVKYSAVPFKSGDKEHNKIPVRISYDSYTGGTLARRAEYVLTSCAFDNE